jgi:hypothetical protein
MREFLSQKNALRHVLINITIIIITICYYYFVEEQTATLASVE